MAAPLRIDFVSDVTCPWCAIGLQALGQAIARLGDDRKVELHLQPFELNPGIPTAGEPIADYAARKYGVGAAELAARQAFIRQRGAEAGLALAERTHVYNTFDAHRLLVWAGRQGRALELKRALLQAYHERGENPALADVLLRAVAAAGRLDERRGTRGPGQRCLRRRSARQRAPVAAARHRLGAGGGDRRAQPALRRPVGTGVRAGLAAVLTAHGGPKSGRRALARSGDRPGRPARG